MELYLEEEEFTAGLKYLFRIPNSNGCRSSRKKSSVRADHLIQALLPALELVEVGTHDATVDGKLRITVVRPES